MDNGKQEGCVLALGNFDGIHLGHRALMEEVFKKKLSLGAKGEVLTFSPHPLTYFTGQTLPLLMNDEDKIQFFYDYMGIDKVSVWAFGHKLSSTSPEGFLKWIMKDFGNIRHLVVGFNYTFGKGGKGDTAFIEEFCREQKIACSVIPAVCVNQGVVSSSRIRQLISQGELEEANQLLGYWYSISGEVKKGNQLGREMGFNTANILPDAIRQLPPNGVYAARIRWQGNYYDGVVNIGCRPTVDKEGSPKILESHLFLEGDPDLYGQNLKVYLAKFIRPEKRFKSREELKAEVHFNIRQARDYLSQIPLKQHLPNQIK